MPSVKSYLLATVCILFASVRVARADVCVAVDPDHDTLQPGEQAAAVLLLGRQFEQEGERVVTAGCSRSYVVVHAQLGDTIVVNVTGPDGRWDAVALGANDLPAVYGQIVRSIVTKRPMTGLNVVDRTNVTASQASSQRVHTDSLWYARLGYGGLFGDRRYGTPAFGFGYRAELDSLGIDVSFFNFQLNPSDSYSGSSEASAGSWLKLSGLYFTNPRANRSAYFGGGLSYGHSSFGTWNFPTSNPYAYRTNWRGSGLQGELTAGYELARVTSVRMFVQTDVMLPFYRTVSETYARFGPVGRDERYAPSAVISIALGR